MEGSNNNIGILRLFFASLVIVSHATSLTGVTEPIASIFPGISMGVIAVDGFFIISGFLIAKSMVRIGSIAVYIEKRVLRIYPAFIFAYIFSVFIVGTIVHAKPWLQIPETFFRLLTLQPPLSYPGQLPGVQHFPALNGSMWTIPYEFRCYLLIAVLWGTGLLRRRWIVLGLTCLLILCSALSTFHFLEWRLYEMGSQHFVLYVFGEPLKFLRLTSVFLVGT